jgi:chromosome partitioning protein
MHTICVAQQKGGVGKTTVARLLCEYFARQGQRVLAIDLDHQCSLSSRFLKMEHDALVGDGFIPPLHPEYLSGEAEDPDWDGRTSVADIFFRGPALPYPTPIANLEILPGHGEKLRQTELVERASVKERVHDRLAEVISRPVAAEQWDLVIIDTPPSKGPLATAALRAASHVLFPCTMEPQSVEGLVTMLSLSRRQNRHRAKPIQILGILPTKMKRNVTLHSDVYKDLIEEPGLKDLILGTVIGDRIAFAESDHRQAKPQSIFDLAQSNGARRDAEAFCQEIQRRMAT